MLDCLTDGRLAAGFPVGTSMDVNRCYGVTPTETRPRFYEAHDLIMKAWTQARAVHVQRPLQQAALRQPVAACRCRSRTRPCGWPAAVRSRRTRWRSSNDYTYSFLSFFGYQFAKKVMDGFWETADRLGVDQNPYQAGFAQQICVSETDALAEEEYMEHVTYFFKKCLHIPPYYFETPGYRTRRSTEFAHQDERARRRSPRRCPMEKNWKALVDNGFIIAGSPATVADRLIEACQGPAGRQPRRPAADRLDAPRADRAEPHAVRREVIPKHPHLWADDGWKHEWWPQGARQDAPVARVRRPAKETTDADT